MAPDPVFRQAERLADLTHLVFKEHAQRLNQLEDHFLRQATYIMMRLDARSCPGCIMAGALYNVGIEGSLGEKRDRAVLLLKLLGLFFKNTNKFLADNMAFFFRVYHICQAC